MLSKSKRKQLILIFILISVGIALVVLTGAASPATAIEPENGSLSTNAKIVTASGASNGKSVQFKKQSVGRAYPLHTNINATTFWVGELFQNTSDGSQVCSAYVEDWIWNHFRLVHSSDCKLPQNLSGRAAGCDALLANENGKCDENNSIGSLRTPANGYFPQGLQPVYENPFYLDLPYNDYTPSGGGYLTGWATRCQDIPWANDPGYAGNCTNPDFSYMKNRWVKVMANGKTCYGQIEDAGPADVDNGNPHYDDRVYVFGSNDARPLNTSYQNAGMDISPALGACLGGSFNDYLKVSWQFVDDVDVPAGPWKTIITSSPPTWD